MNIGKLIYIISIGYYSTFESVGRNISEDNYIIYYTI